MSKKKTWLVINFRNSPPTIHKFSTEKEAHAWRETNIPTNYSKPHKPYRATFSFPDRYDHTKDSAVWYEEAHGFGLDVFAAIIPTED